MTSSETVVSNAKKKKVIFLSDLKEKRIFSIELGYIFHVFLENDHTNH